MRYRPIERETSHAKIVDRGTADTCRGRAGRGAGRLTSAAGRCHGPSGPPSRGPGDRSPSGHVAPGGRGAIAPLAEGVAVGGGRGRPGVRRLRPGADRQDDDGDGLHRRRLRQRPRDLRGPPGRRPGEPGPGGRQRPGEEGGPAGPARQGAVPGPGRPQEGGRGQRRGRPEGRARPRSGASWPRPGASAGSSRGRSRTSTTRSRSSRPGSRPCGARRRPSTAPGPTSPGPSSSSTASAIAREEFDQRREAERTAEAAVKQALEEVHETRVALGLAPHPEKGGPDRRPRRPQPDLLRGPRGAGRRCSRAWRRSAYPLGSIDRHAPAGPRRVRPARQGGEHRPHPGADGARRPRRSGRPRPSSSRPGATSPRRS